MTTIAQVAASNGDGARVSVRDMARIALEAKEAAESAEYQRSQDENYAALAPWLVEELARIGIAASQQDIERRDAWPFYVADGITFTVRDYEDDSPRYLVVVLPCSVCGRECQARVWSLEVLGELLRSGANHSWPERCAQEITDIVDHTAVAIGDVEERAQALGEALADEARLEDERALVKASAIIRLLDAKVATSATAAEKIVEQDDQYAAHRAHQRAQIIERMRKWGLYESAKLRALRLVQQERPS